MTPLQSVGPSSPTDSTWSQSYWQAKLSFPIEDDMPKKKRTRITKEQLAQLEHHFAVDCSPTTVQRREVGLQIGIPERRIQIWFQNRRAKARNNGETGRFRLSGSIPLGHPPELAQATQMELAALTQEDGPIFIIPCTNITIGAWNRVGSQDKDLLAWVCDSKKTLTWFIRSDEYCFKMRISLEHVVQLEYSNGSQFGQGIVTIDLSQPPEFFLRKDITSEDGGPSPGWEPCNDWTEDKEASCVLRHVLGGAALPLSYIV
ncbi:homeobox-domain-containing protein, partial [Macrolepiota fuliginosa MF-IS2]